MPPAVAAIASIAVAVGTTFIKSAIVKALVTIAATVAISLLTKKPKGNKLNQGTELSTKIDASMPRQVLVGRIATGGSCHFVHTTTNDQRKPNRYLYRVIVLSDQPVDALVGVYDETKQVTFAGDITTGWFASNQYKNKDNQPCLWARLYKGSFTPVADALLIAETGKWTPAHKGVGLCYVILKMDYDADAFPNGEPTFTFVLDGARLYDDRMDSTVPGGAGTQRLNNYSTWVYTNNASVITTQFLRGFYINGVRIVGVGADTRDMRASNLMAAHNTCDQEVVTLNGTVERYTAGYIISANEAATNILEDLQLAMDGQIFDRGGYITLLPGAIRTPVMHITENDIDWTAEKSFQPSASLESMLNFVHGNFVDGDNFFAETDLPVFKNAQWELDDGGERFSAFLSLRAVTRWEQGQRILKRIHQASRYSGIISFVGGLWLLELEQGDWVTLTSARWNISNKYYEVQECTITKDMRVMVVLRAVSPNIDVWDSAEDEIVNTSTTGTYPPYTLPAPIIGLTPVREMDNLTGMQTFGINVELIDPSSYGSYIKRIEIEYRDDASGVVYTAGSFGLSNAKLSITGLLGSKEYSVRARTTDDARTSAWSMWYATTTMPALSMTIEQILAGDTSLATVLQEAIALAEARGRVTVGGDFPPLAESLVGDTHVGDDGVFYERVAGPISLEGTLIIGDTNPALYWAATQAQPIVVAGLTALWDNITGDNRPEDNADVTANAQVVITQPPPQIIYRDFEGTPKAGQFPITVKALVRRGGVNISDAEFVTYAITTSGVTATVDNTDDVTKGTISVTDGGIGYINLTITVSGVAYGPFRINFSTQDDVPPTSSGSTGAIKQRSDSSISPIPLGSSNADQLTSMNAGESVFLITVASGESLKCTAPLEYKVTAGGSGRLIAKWQYKPSGGSWTDIGAYITGDYAFSFWDGEIREQVDAPSNGVFNQTKTGLTAGDYEVRLYGYADGANITVLSGIANVIAE